MSTSRRQLEGRRLIGPLVLAGFGVIAVWSVARTPPLPSSQDASTSPAFADDVARERVPRPAAPVVAPSGITAASSDVERAAPTELRSVRPRLRAELPRWLRVARETGLWSGPDEGQEFTRVTPTSIVRVLDKQGGRFRVFYAGDEEIKRSGEAWINATDAHEMEWPTFVVTRASTALRTSPSESSPTVITVSSRTYLEVLETSGRDWAHVFLPTRPDNGEPLDAWVDGEDVQATPRDPAEFLEYTLTRAQVSERAPEAWLGVPYRSQLDGATYEAANCGPTSLWMALSRGGRAIPSLGILRAETLRYQDIDHCDDCGVYIEHLAAVAEAHGARSTGLYDVPGIFHRWTMDEIREQLRSGNVVVPQVMYRFLSGRERSDYWGDHYVVVTGIVGDRFIYHDPIDTRGPGSSRTIAADRLLKAMEHSDFPYAAFAVSP